MIGLTIDEIQEGDEAEIVRVAAERDIAGFVDAVGDDNPIHSDPAYAADSMFKERIAPGIWTAGLISAVIGTRLPGPGTIYVSQELKFVRPVKLGDAIRARVQVVETNRERNRVRLRTVCRNQRGEDVLTGEAVVMPSRTPVVYRRPLDLVGMWTAWALEPWSWVMEGAAVAASFAAAAAPPGPPPQRV
jgi:acyl dehydratase